MTDVYIYLSNDVPDQMRRKTLMSDCMRLLEQDFKRTKDPADAPDGRLEPAMYLGPDQPYLDMTKSSFVTSSPKALPINNDNETNNQSTDDATTIDANETIFSEYVDVNTTSVVEEDNVNYVNGSVSNATHQQKSTSLGNSTHYDQLQFQEWPADSTTSSSAAPDSSSIVNECPYGGLPAAHLSLRQATHIGWLTQHRRYLTAKRYYAGVLDGWLLMYASGDAAIRPSSCYALRRCSWTDSQDSNDKFRLTLVTDALAKKKTRHFQMNCHKDLQQWVMAFAEAKPAACLNLFGARKLPTPPPSPTATDTGPPINHSHSGSSTASTISLEVDPNKDNVLAPPSPKIYVNQRNKVEEIYEEPVELLASLNRLKRQQLAKPVSVVVVPQEYDIPKPKPRPVNSPQPITLPIESPPPCSSETPNTGDSFEEIKSKVAAQLLANSGGQSPLRAKSEHANNEEPTQTRRRRSDMRSWLYRMSRRGRRSLIHVVTKTTSRGNSMTSKTADDHRIDEESPIGNTSTSRKGSGKVNAIINQLEAKGHRAPMFRVAINRTKGGKWTTGGGGKKGISVGGGGDEHNYEPVTVVTTT